MVAHYSLRTGAPLGESCMASRAWASHARVLLCAHLGLADLARQHLLPRCRDGLLLGTTDASSSAAAKQNQAHAPAEDSRRSTRTRVSHPITGQGWVIQYTNKGVGTRCTRFASVTK